MQKKLNILLLVILVILGATLLYQKSYSVKHEVKVNPVTGTIELTSIDSGKTLPAAIGQTFKITLGNPGDTGARFDIPEYDTSILHLDTHYHNPPATKMMGDFGSDVWVFSTIARGTTNLAITASRPWNQEKMFAFKYSFIVQ